MVSRAFLGPGLGGSAPFLGSKVGRKQRKNNTLSDSRTRHLRHHKARPSQVSSEAVWRKLDCPFAQSERNPREGCQPPVLSLAVGAGKGGLGLCDVPQQCPALRALAGSQKEALLQASTIRLLALLVLITAATKWPGSTKLTSSLTNICGHLPPQSQPGVGSPFFLYLLIEFI